MISAPNLRRRCSDAKRASSVSQYTISSAPASASADVSLVPHCLINRSVSSSSDFSSEQYLGLRLIKSLKLEARFLNSTKSLFTTTAFFPAPFMQLYKPVGKRKREI